MSSVFGITAGTYPSNITITKQTVLSDYAPQISPVSCFFLRCSLVSNPFSGAAPDVLTSFTDQGTSVGDLISVRPTEYAWISVPDQNVNKITLTIVDQDFRFVKLEDSKITVEILVRTPRV
jgi:hypothetical protein